MERYPLNWPANKPRTAAAERKSAAFNKAGKPVSVAEGVKRVEAELDSYTKVGRPYRVPLDTVIISTNLSTGVKGKPLSSLPEPADPGVAVYFQLDGRDYCLPCDKWNRVGDNLAAIAAHINALRGIERWGVGQQHDVYTGFKALPENASPGNGNHWTLVFGLDADAMIDVVKDCFKQMAQRYHPDKPHGNENIFKQVNEAWNQFKKERGLK
ncbi:J domain-containing protein [Mucilaginibacter limnophilus]|uniref:J domain-containing protein n=1 Tax=Mucilaginibacter limnophilus TaxID=1932778 RepID=A0A437MTV7_9SPHI|nr:J domain-containing protein [Mucilaginibacter limnophilus]RVU01105.1 J domain-containing protein [Mucilaginibacter limnophilus]